MKTNLYLHFNGNCAEAFKFYETALGGKIDVMMPHTGTPAEADMPAGWGDKIIHGRITVGDALIMASDAPPGRYHPQKGFAISLRTDTPQEAERLFKVLSEGGQAGMPLSETFFAHRFGMVTDRFDIPWMVLCERTM